jgi:hypothetical protein
MLLRAYLSMPALFMMVSLPDEAAFTICCSTDLFILALSAYNGFQAGVYRGMRWDQPCAWLPV